jgi:hypothetical protein
MTRFNLIKNLGGALKKFASIAYPIPRRENNFAIKTAAKVFSSYAKDYSTHEALKLQETEDENKQTEKTSAALAENQEAAESWGLKDVKLESGGELNGAASSSHYTPGPRGKSEFEKESGLTIEQFDEILEQEPTNWEYILSLPLKLLPRQFHGLLLNYSIIDKNTDIFKQLIFEKGLDVNAEDAGGNDPLLLAADMGTSEMAEILLKQGAKPNLEHELFNPYEVAAARGEDSLGRKDGVYILKLLFEYCPPEDKEIIYDVGDRLRCKGNDEMHDLARELIGEDVFNDIYENS